MTRQQKVITKLLSGSADANLDFSDVVSLLLALGFEMRIKGSHHIFRKEGVNGFINLQKEGNKLKPYQARQVRIILTDNKLIE